jgi:AmmeMemoRadiSam system protein A
MSLSPTEGRALLALARAALSQELEGNGALDRALGALDRTPSIEEEGACFVTLEVRDALSPRGVRLRGCVGSLQAHGPLYRNVIENAGRAAFHDPRFPALSAAELAEVAISLSILSPLVPVEGIDRIAPGVDGVVLEKGSFRSVFLPEVASEQGWDRVALLRNLALKAGLPRDGWNGATLFVFRTATFEEDGSVAL